MAFYLSNGDTVQSNIVVAGLKDKTYIIPGVTVRDDIEFTSAETLKYWVPGATSAASVNTPGSQITINNTALVAKTLVLSKSIQLGGRIPGVNIKTVKADQVNAHVQRDVLKGSNLINEAFITAAETAAQSGTYPYVGTDVYADLAEMRAEYCTTNKVDGYKPTFALVNSDIYSKLMAKNLITFKDNKGYILDMAIIECPDLTSNAILGHYEAMVAGASYEDVEVVSAATQGYAGGVCYVGEIPYGCAAAEFPSDFTGHLLIKF